MGRRRADFYSCHNQFGFLKGNMASKNESISCRRMEMASA